VSEEDINVAAFLKLIRYAEHKSDDDRVYFLLYGGQQTFVDTTKHPNKAITAWGRTSTAAGAYQILYSTWKEAKDKGVVIDFSKAAQDTLATSKLRSRGAYPYIVKGDIEHAVARLRNEWTSMPGAAQSDLSMATARKQFDKYVAELAGKK
jgi:muramidase (phage lysozyme)